MPSKCILKVVKVAPWYGVMHQAAPKCTVRMVVNQRLDVINSLCLAIVHSNLFHYHTMAKLDAIWFKDTCVLIHFQSPLCYHMFLGQSPLKDSSLLFSTCNSLNGHYINCMIYVVVAFQTRSMDFLKPNKIIWDWKKN